MPGRIKWPLIYAEGRGFVVSFVSIFMALINYLPLLTSENETKMLLRAVLSGRSLERLLAQQGRKMRISDVGSAIAPENDGHLFWDCPFHPFGGTSQQP